MADKKSWLTEEDPEIREVDDEYETYQTRPNTNTKTEDANPEVLNDGPISVDEYISDESNNGSWLKEEDPVDDNYIPIKLKQNGVVKDAEGDVGYTKDFILSAGVGTTNAIEETLDALSQISGLVDQKTIDARIIPEWYKPQTGLGVATEGISRFLAGFGAAGKGLKAAGWAARGARTETTVDVAKTTGEVVKDALKSDYSRLIVKGGISDFFVFDPQEGRLTDMVHELDAPWLEAVTFDYLRSDDDDTVLEGRLKNVLEGMFIGGIVDSLMIGFRAMKRAAKDPENAPEHYQKAQELIDARKAVLDEDARNFEVVQLVNEQGTPIKGQYVIKKRGMVEGDYDLTGENITDLGIFKTRKQAQGVADEIEFDATGETLKARNMSGKERFVLQDNGNETFTIIDQRTLDKDLKPLELITGSKEVADDFLKDIKSKQPTRSEQYKRNKRRSRTKQERREFAEDNPAINIEVAEKGLKLNAKNAKQKTTEFLENIFNTKSFTGGQHFLKTIEDAISMFDDDQIKYLTSDKLTNEVALQLATVLGRNVEEVIAAMPKQAEYAKQSVIRMLAGKSALQRLADQIQELGDTVVALTKKNGTKDIDLPGQTNYRHWSADEQAVVIEYQRLSAVLADSSFYLKEQIRSAAQLTQAGRIKVGLAEGKLEIDQLVDTIESFSKNPLEVAQRMQGKGVGPLVDELAHLKSSKAVETFNSLYVNSLLSSPWTNLINIGTGLYEAVIRPLELYAGAFSRGDKKSMQVALAQYTGMLQSWKDILRMTRLSWEQGDAILDKKMQTIESRTKGQTISSKNYGMKEGNAASVVDFVGYYLELPSRFLTSGDELLKQANYRGQLHALAVEKNLDLGVTPGSDAWKALINDEFARGFNADGTAAVKRNPLAAKALEYAQESTFTNKLKGGSHIEIASNIEDFFNKVPQLRFIMPFIRTPTNLWRHTSNRLPALGAFTKQNMDKWKSGDPRLRSEVVGRQIYGTAITGMALYYVMNDVVIEDKNGKVKELPRITGKGPTNRTARDLLHATGWQPYSILMNDGTDDEPKWVYKQYNRADPRFFMFGLLADIFEVSKFDPTADNTDLLIGIAQSIAKNTTDKSYTKGLGDALDMLEDGKNAEKFVGNMINNVIPYSGLRRFGVQEFDPEGYEIRTILDPLLAGVGLTSTLEPKRDWKGDPIVKNRTRAFWNDNGFSFVLQAPALIGRKSEVKDGSDVVFKMAQLLSGYSKIEKNSLHKDINLEEYRNKNNQTALDYFRENIGKVRVSNMKIEEYMKNKMNSYEFRNAGQGDPDDPGGKEFLMRKYYEAFRQTAKAKLLENGYKFKSEDGTRLSNFYVEERNGKYKYFKKDAPHIKKRKKLKVEKLIGF